MMPTIAPPSVLSAPQRRCQVLLTLFQPETIATVEIFSALNGVDDDTAREDITETSPGDPALSSPCHHNMPERLLSDRRYSTRSAPLPFTLAQAWPAFMPDLRHATVYPGLKNALKQRGIARPLYDDINLHALINLCARRLQKPFEHRDVQFLRLFYSIVCYNTMLASPRNSTLCSRFGRSRARNIHSPRNWSSLAAPRDAGRTAQ